jgi:hypothetical protein
MVTTRILRCTLACLSLVGCGGSTAIGGAGDGDSSLNGSEPGSGAKSGGPKSSGGMSTDVGGTPSSGGSSSVAGSDVGGSRGAQYPGTGFVVHEWGTDTVVVGSDGSLQRGLHHEEEDLPAFVYDRIKAASLMGDSFSPSVTIKMETPVTYFYSDVPRTVHAGVAFPKGVLTQWYPGVTSFLPPVAAPSSMPANEPATFADPVLDPTFPFMSDLCRTKFSTVGSGSLDWGDISVLARGANVGDKLPAAALDKFSWSHARAVDSNPVQIANGETERFLFYRGLGDFDLPVSVKITGPGIAGLGGNPVVLKNTFSEAIGSVFMMNVGKDEAVFTHYSHGIGAGGELSEQLPMLYGTTPLDYYTEELGQAVTGALDDTGLYHDEAVAMVNTWKRQWFRTPGIRLLYVIPQSWTDASIPLTIEPKPDATLRVMLIRVEVITPEQEAEDVASLNDFEAAPGSARAHFASLGRFAEPRLRRALALAPSTGGQAYLEQIRTANTSVSSGE